MGSPELFAGTVILLISTSQVARIIDMSHHAWLSYSFFYLPSPLTSHNPGRNKITNSF
jgi:hypothetical protein